MGTADSGSGLFSIIDPKAERKDSRELLCS